MTVRDSIVVGNILNFPLKNPANDRVLGIFSLAMPIVVFMDTLFEKKRPNKRRPELHYVAPPPSYNFPHQFVYNSISQEPSTFYTNPYAGAYGTAPEETSHFKTPQHHESGSVSQSYANSHFKDNIHLSQNSEGSHSHFQKHHVRRQEQIPGDGYNQYDQNYDLNYYDNDAAQIPQYSQQYWMTNSATNERVRRSERDNGHNIQEDESSEQPTQPYKSYKRHPPNAIEIGATRSASDDQASVYRQLSGMMTTAGVDGAGCLQYLVCRLGDHRRGQWGEDQGENYQQFDETNEEFEGKISKSAKQEKNKFVEKMKAEKKTRKRSLVADIISALLLPKPDQPLSEYVAAADRSTQTSTSCGERYQSCPAVVTSLVNSLLD